MSLDQELAVNSRAVSEDTFREIHMLAARLREQLGEIDDAAIQAVSEATGAPEEYVRLAVRSAPSEERQTFVDRMKGSFLAFDPDMRRYTMAGVLGAMGGLALAISAAVRDTSGFMGALSLIALLGGCWNAAVAKDSKAGALSGAVYGGVTFLIMTLFTFLFHLLPNVNPHGPHPMGLLAWVVGGTFVGALANRVFALNRGKLGMRDPGQERQALLQQLQDIQEKLKSDERFVTFLSVDIVGSTRIKTESDPLTVEFTFTEYHKFVESVVERFGGKVHSTAGDGVTCVFESPQMGYAAGRALLSGLFEFNSYRNRLAKPIELRAGVHTGSAHVAGQSLTNVNFAQVIDVAAHMQKSGEPGTLIVSETTANYVVGGPESIGEHRITVHDFQAIVWKPKVTVSASPAPGL
ncbi:MAG: adenylate/guanylate cyclase domain-containing protein [Armatimonadetes bacterium]|nr:adenylate/guanylate cyclase domain-containing protein [Armatimonadota bacterium]